MDAALETALTKREYRVLGLDQPIQITSDEMLDRVMSELAGNYSGCQPITSAQTAEAGKWLKEAADGGPTDAMNGYGSLLDDHKLALDYIERAWSLGSMSSLKLLSRIYLSQYENGDEPGNNIKAYAAYYAYAMLHEQRFVEHGADPTEINEMHQIQLDRLESSLTPSTRELAIVEAMEMIRANTNCCYTN